MEGSYAERYRELRQRAEQEEPESDTSESDSDVSEDEEGEQLTPQVDAAILRTLQKIRSKDPEVYRTDTRVFDHERDEAAKHNLPAIEKHSSKKLTLQDYQRQRLQEAMDTESDPARAFAEATSKQHTKQESARQPTHDEEQQNIRNEFLTAVPEGDNDELFQVRRDDEPQDTYRTALIGALDGGDENEVRSLLHNPEQGGQGLSKENEDFLLNYVLNRGWVDKGSAQKQGDRDWDAEAAELDSEASFDSAADAFEHAYNFRFEDPSLAQQNFAIQSFPRHSNDTVRRSDDRRKIARQERAERKAKEKEDKMHKLDQIKAQKRKSIAEQLKKLRDVAGGDNRMDDGMFEGLDLEGDFDPEEHDRMMQKQFGDEYYRGESNEKPRWEEDDELNNILEENQEPQRKKKSKKQDSGGMDADFLNGASDAKLSKKERKRLKKQEKKARSKAEHADDPAVDADEMDADKADVGTEQDRKAKARELMDEYYNLGYEDLVGDIPTRFKYASVPKEDYGMSAVEILLADDAELNNVVGLKHLQPYRRNQSKPANLNKKLKRFREELDAKTSTEDTESQERPKKKRLGKKERNKLKAQQAAENTD